MEEESSSFHFIIRKALYFRTSSSTSDRRLLRQGLLLFSSTLGRHLDMNIYFQEHYSQSYVPKCLTKECKKERKFCSKYMLAAKTFKFFCLKKFMRKFEMHIYLGRLINLRQFYCSFQSLNSK